MSVLKLAFLGSPVITLDAAPVELNLRRAMAMLSYLAVTGQRHSRDSLAELLFPEGVREDSRAYVRRTLSVLRGCVGWDRLRADRGSIWIAPREDTRIDVSDYRALIWEARALDDRGDPAGRMDRLERAAELYRGEFLGGFYLKDSPGFEDWQLAEAESLRSEQALLLRTLADAHERRGDLSRAIEHARRLLALDALDESAHRALMRLYARDGRRSMAIRQYESCARTLKRELDEAPEKDTRDLLDAVKAGRIPAEMGNASSLASSEPRRRRGAPPARVQAHADGFRIVIAGAGLERHGPYRSAQAALAASLEAQRRSLPGQSLAWDAIPLGADDEERGKEASRRARHLRRAGHPGQVLLSEQAALRVLAELPGIAGARSLGTHRLADLGPPVRIHQLVHADLPQELAPLVTLDTVPNNLPMPPTPFVGREQELEAVVETLLRPEVRLLTLTGVGGSGKTRVALQAAAELADRFEHGAWLADLSLVGKPGEVLSHIAASLNVPDLVGRAAGLASIVRDHLESKSLLLVLDNFEHVREASSEVAAVILACPGLKVLATSREPLGLRAERLHPVPPLSLPEPGDTLERLRERESVRFFTARARMARPDLALTPVNAPAIAGICSRLDGLPLALELGATWMRTLTPEALLDRLSSSEALAIEGHGDLPFRQRTLEREIAWSHDLLGEADRRLFSRASVFMGSFTREAVAAVASLPGDQSSVNVDACLASLVDKSLLSMDAAAGEPRYRMLQTIRSFGLGCLERAGETAAVHQRSAAYFVELACSMAARKQMKWDERSVAFCADYSNFIDSLQWLSSNGAWREGARLAGTLAPYWEKNFQRTAGSHWLELFLEHSSPEDPPWPRAQMMYNLAPMKGWVSDPYTINPLALELYKGSLRLFHEAGDQVGTAMAMAQVEYWDPGLAEPDRTALLEEGLRIARATRDPSTIARYLRRVYGGRNCPERDFSVTRSAMEEALSLAGRVGGSELLCSCLHGMGDIYLWSGDVAAAEPWYTRCLLLALEIGDEWETFAAQFHLSSVYLALGNLDKANAACLGGIALIKQYNITKNYLPYFIADLAEIERREGDAARNARLRFLSALLRDPDARYDGAIARELGLEEGRALAEWTAAQSMSREQVIDFAMERRPRARH
jgi:predicted ATPase/DNA-binding SARP family transcriptional activator